MHDGVCFVHKIDAVGFTVAFVFLQSVVGLREEAFKRIHVQI